MSWFESEKCDIILRFFTLAGFIMMLMVYYNGRGSCGNIQTQTTTTQIQVIQVETYTNVAEVSKTVQKTITPLPVSTIKTNSFPDETKISLGEPTPENTSYDRRMWTRVGQPTKPNEITDPRFPPFREESHFMSTNNARALLKGEKFFKEADLGPGKKQHYDARFYKEELSPDQRHTVLVDLFKEFTELMDHYNVKYWLDFGTLIGWYWHKGMLPWDDDVDVGVHWNFLFPMMWISKVYNNDKYLLEVNPNFVVNERLMGNNMIDARFICRKTGAFIDIVAYSGLYDDKIMMMNELGTNAWMESKYFTDKDNHSPVPSSFLFPLQRSNWENITVWVPAQVENFLHLIYGQKSTTVYGEYEMNYYTNQWRLKGDAVPKIPVRQKERYTSMMPIFKSSLRFRNSLPSYYTVRL